MKTSKLVAILKGSSELTSLIPSINLMQAPSAEKKYLVLRKTGSTYAYSLGIGELPKKSDSRSIQICADDFTTIESTVEVLFNLLHDEVVGMTWLNATEDYNSDIKKWEAVIDFEIK